MTASYPARSRGNTHGVPTPGRSDVITPQLREAAWADWIERSMEVMRQNWLDRHPGQHVIVVDAFIEARRQEIVDLSQRSREEHSLAPVELMWALWVCVEQHICDICVGVPKASRGHRDV